MQITFARNIKGRTGKSWEWIILGGSELRGKVHRAKVDWQGHRATVTPTPIIMEVGHIGRIASMPYWFWVVGEMSHKEFNEECGIICEMCREEVDPDYKHYGHK